MNTIVNKKITPCTNPLELFELVIYIFEFADNDSLDALVRVCRLFQSAIMKQPLLEVRLWKGRFFKLSEKYETLKKTQLTYPVLDTDESMSLTFNFIIPPGISNVTPICNPQVPLKRVRPIENLPDRINNLHQKRIEKYKGMQPRNKNEDKKVVNKKMYKETIPEREIYMRLNEENASVLTIATNVIDYSIYSFKQRMKAKRSDEFIGQVYISRLEEYDKKIYGIARDRLIDRPISKIYSFLSGFGISKGRRELI